MPELKRLRDLPGVMEIERMCGVAEAWDGYNRSWTRHRIDQVSISLFSLPHGETSYDCFEWDEDEEDRPTREQWDSLMSNALRPYAETEQFWTGAMGWDITDGDEHELKCAHWFAAQIIICETGLVEEVFFTPDGSGKEPVGDGPDLTEEKLADKLEDEVRAFLTRRSA
jgi:hypothetical protein